MSEQGFAVRRPPVRRWYLALIGAVLVLHGGGVLFGWYPTVRVLELLYPGREAPAFESRDLAWAVAFLIIGVLLVALTALRMVDRRPIVRAGKVGVSLSLGGPLARPVSVPWENLREVSVGEASDEFGAYPTLLLRVADQEPASALWGAEWNEGVLAIPAADWNCRVEDAAGRLAEVKASLDSGFENREAESPPSSEPPGVQVADEVPEGELSGTVPAPPSEGVLA